MGVGVVTDVLEPHWQVLVILRLRWIEKGMSLYYNIGCVGADS